MKAATKLKRLINRKKPQFMDMFGSRSDTLVAPPEEMDRVLSRTVSDLRDERPNMEGDLAGKGIHRELSVNEQLEVRPASAQGRRPDQPSKPTWPPTLDSTKYETPEWPGPSHVTRSETPRSDGGKGHAHDPLEDTLYLRIGTGCDDHSNFSPDGEEGDNNDYDGIPVVSESPSNVDMNVYEKAYEEEIQRILAAKAGQRPTLYLTRRVEGIPHLRDHKGITDFTRASRKVHTGLRALAELSRKPHLNLSPHHSDSQSGEDQSHHHQQLGQQQQQQKKEMMDSSEAPSCTTQQATDAVAV